MGMTIDEARRELISGKPDTHKFAMALVIAIDTMCKYQQLQADYENRLKADLVAMLTEIQLEIEEKQFLESSCSFMDKTEEKNYAVYTDDISKVIQQKIDALKTESEG